MGDDARFEKFLTCLGEKQGNGEIMLSLEMVKAADHETLEHLWNNDDENENPLGNFKQSGWDERDVIKVLKCNSTSILNNTWKIRYLMRTDINTVTFYKSKDGTGKTESF